MPVRKAGVACPYPACRMAQRPVDVERRRRRRRAAAQRGKPHQGKQQPAEKANRMDRRSRHLASYGSQILGKLRSEEHTSELQSLMRISYAVLCLKKKKQNTYT